MPNAQNPSVRPDWAKPENWPARRQAPGYPRRVVLPSTVVLVFAVAMIATGLERGSTVLFWLGLAVLVVGQLVVYRLTVARFTCPECARVITRGHYPAPRGFLTFHCWTCNIVWLTGILVTEDSDGGGEF